MLNCGRPQFNALVRAFKSNIQCMLVGTVGAFTSHLGCRDSGMAALQKTGCENHTICAPVGTAQLARMVPALPPVDSLSSV